jgi:tRNA(fMet)-specific endonuclease VapC
MAYLLDSDIVIDHLVDDPEAVRLVARLAPSGLSMSAVSYMEAFQGVGRDKDPAAMAAALQTLVATVPVLPFATREARRCAGIRETLRARGRRVTSRALDLMIAATAIEHGLILITRNTRDYRDLPGPDLYRSS